MGVAVVALLCGVARFEELAVLDNEGELPLGGTVGGICSSLSFTWSSRSALGSLAAGGRLFGLK